MPRLSPDRRRRGFSLLELSVVLVVLLVALLIFSSTVSGMAKQRLVNGETSIAVAAVRNTLETLRAEPFEQVFARYNPDPLDDPGGAGSAPGATFVVGGLEPCAGAPDDRQGEILFPTVIDAEGRATLREDVELRRLGMPRDLSGDQRIDALDHAAGYFLLPVAVRVRWQGPAGERQYEMATQLCRYRKE